MKSLRYLVLFPMIILGSTVFAQPGSYYPPPGNVDFHNDTLTICPPDSLPGDPVVLIGYNIYVDSVFYDNVPVSNPADTIDFIFTYPALPPGDHAFCAKAIYNQWISDFTCDSATVIYGYELPFLEDWSSGSFEELHWMPSSGNWVISYEEGNPAPAAEFHSDPVLTNYAINLESFPINALGMTQGSIWLDYYLKLDDSRATGNEIMRIQTWNWNSNEWYTVNEYRNDDGSQTWPSEHINIGYRTRDKVFRVRFQAIGMNSADIQGWTVDNIHLYRTCVGPYDLQLVEFWDQNQLKWDPPEGCYIDEWIHWDDNQNSGNSIGTGEAAEFDVAARWTPSQLTYYHDCSIYKIKFFPAEPSATYNVRVWVGAGPDTLVVDQAVANPVIGQWNYVILISPLKFDVTKELWVGYHVNTPTGYPAGVDDGPAKNGYGNMIYYDSTWSTLLEINGDLDYNWNIACLIALDAYSNDSYYKLYRKSNEGEFQLYDTLQDNEFQDTSIVLSDHYCYQVTLMWIHHNDTCESVPTNTVCETVNVGTDQPEQKKAIKIYPNPAKNWLNIESDEEIRIVRFYNLLGEMILEKEVNNQVYQLNVNNFRDGIYYVTVETRKRDFKAKVVILK